MARRIAGLFLVAALALLAAEANPLAEWVVQATPLVGAGGNDTNSTAQCSTHRSCVALGLTGDCCPSAGASMLECCEAECTSKKNGRCAQAGLEGYCCPTMDGEFLDCCGEAEDDAGEDMGKDMQLGAADVLNRRPGGKAGLVLSAAAGPAAGGDAEKDGESLGEGNATEGNATEGNAAEGLVLSAAAGPGAGGDAEKDSESLGEGNATEGNATEGLVLSAAAGAVAGGDTDKDGESLGEGNATEGNATEGSSTAQCSAHPSCVALGLTGECCPSAGGSMLECCEAECNSKKNGRCAQAGLEGYCCPTMDGEFLDCCGEAEDNAGDEHHVPHTRVGDDGHEDGAKQKEATKPLLL